MHSNVQTMREWNAKKSHLFLIARGFPWINEFRIYLYEKIKC